MRATDDDPSPHPATPVHFALAPTDELPVLLRRALAAVGVHPADDGVWIDGDVLTASFGPWRVGTPMSNVVGAEVTGPYSVWKAIGPRLSLADRGLTFGTTARAGVCIAFREPVAGIEPTGLLRHPNLTVTVAEPASLVRHLRALLHR